MDVGRSLRRRRVGGEGRRLPGGTAGYASGQPRYSQTDARLYGSETHRQTPRDKAGFIMQTAVALSDVTPHRFTIKDYLRMGEVGIIAQEERVELIDGQVERMSPIGNWHTRAVAILTTILTRQVGANLLCSPAGGLNIGLHTRLMPDFVIAKDSKDWEAGLHGADCLLVVEVAYASLVSDRTRKRVIYASEGVSEYWIVDLAGRALEVYREPKDGDYRSFERFGQVAVVTCKSVPGIEIAVSEITPPEGVDPAAEERPGG